MKTNKYYIPGETGISERLRKRAYDSGTFSLLIHLYLNLKSESFKDARNEINDKIINFLTEQDLGYHKRYLKFIRDNPPVETVATG